MQARSFQLTGYTVTANSKPGLENARLSNLRSVIRESIARGITLVLDEERFLYRVTEVIVESSGYPNVAAYVTESGGDRFALGAASQSAPEWLPKRLPASAVQSADPSVVRTSSIFGEIAGLGSSNSIVIPLVTNGSIEGAILIIDVGSESVSGEDLEAFAVVAEEISPAIRVASAHRRVRNSVIIDMDTGAYTYEFFIERLEQELSRAQRTERAVTIVLIEASHFEEFEMTAGYETADRILKDLATGFADILRSSDVVARRGRTGFALLLPDSDVEGAAVTIQRIEDRLAQVDVALEEQGYEGPLPGITAGSATYPVDGQESAELVLAADQRMLADSAIPNIDE